MDQLPPLPLAPCAGFRSAWGQPCRSHGHLGPLRWRLGKGRERPGWRRHCHLDGDNALFSAGAGDRDKTVSCSRLVSKRKNFVSRGEDPSAALRGTSRLGVEKFLGLLRPPAPSPCPGGVQPRILGCATPRQPRCPPAHGNRTGGRTATKATGLHGPPPKRKNTGRVSPDPLLLLPGLLSVCWRGQTPISETRGSGEWLIRRLRLARHPRTAQ